MQCERVRCPELPLRLLAQLCRWIREDSCGASDLAETTLATSHSPKLLRYRVSLCSRCACSCVGSRCLRLWRLQAWLRRHNLSSPSHRAAARRGQAHSLRAASQGVTPAVMALALCCASRSGTLGTPHRRPEPACMRHQVHSHNMAAHLLMMRSAKLRTRQQMQAS